MRSFPIHSPRIPRMERMAEDIPAIIRDIGAICGQKGLAHCD
jgi:hypothetical protein